MPEIRDPGEGEHRLHKPKRRVEKSEEQAEKDAAEAARELGQQAGLSIGIRWAYWQYLRNWKRCGEKGRRWSPRDVAAAHKALAEAVREKNEERVAGLRKFLLLDKDCGERKTNTAEDNDAAGAVNGGRDPQSGHGDVQDKPAVRPRKKRRPKA